MTKKIINLAVLGLILVISLSSCVVDNGSYDDNSDIEGDSLGTVGTEMSPVDTLKADTAKKVKIKKN